MALMIRMWEVLSQKNVEKLLKASELWCGVNAGAVAKAQTNPRLIPAAVHAARIEALQPLFAASEKAGNHGHDGSQ